jgi:hypothetical protein
VRVVPGILATTRARNATHGLTGVLVFDGECFAQHLEGTDAEVDRVFRSIEADPRHAEVEVLSEGPIRSRRYSIWAMAYGRAASCSLIEDLGTVAPDDVADELQSALPSCDLEA